MGNDTNGNVTISKEVISTIIMMAVIDIEGVADTTGNITENFNKVIGRKNLGKGIEIDIEDDKVDITLMITVKYGTELMPLAERIQEKVKSSVETMTNLTVNKINVNFMNVDSNKNK